MRPLQEKYKEGRLGEGTHKIQRERKEIQREQKEEKEKKAERFRKSSLACTLKIHRGEGRVTFISTLEEKAFKVMREREEKDGWKMLKRASLNCPTLNYHHTL